MIGELIPDNIKSQAYKTFTSIFGEPEQLVELRQQLENQLRDHEQIRKKLESDLEKCRQEKLEWMAKEAAVRKELQDCQTRSEDLLEQVVRLTHQKRASAKDLLDQKFKTEATPLERTRFEMELTEARGKVRRAEQRVRVAEEKLAKCQSDRKHLQKRADRVKGLEKDLAWAKKQSKAHLQALGATIAKLRNVESTIANLKKQASLKKYRKPAIKRASLSLEKKFRSAQPQSSI